MFKEGNPECIDTLLIPSKFVLDSGVAIRNEPYDKRQALWNEIKTNADRFRNGGCGKFLSDLAVHFSARFDASLLLLALVFQQNNEQFEGSPGHLPISPSAKARSSPTGSARNWRTTTSPRAVSPPTSDTRSSGTSSAACRGCGPTPW